MALSPKDLDIQLLPERTGVRDFIDNKIKELSNLGEKDPFYVSDLGVVLKKYIGWCDSLPRVKPFYAVKCNPSPTISRILSALGAGFDCASQEEIQLVLSLGVAPSRIIFANPCKAESHIRYACSQGVQMMTFDCLEELTKISRWHDKAKLLLRLAVDDSKSDLRLSYKFGAKLENIHSILTRSLELGLDVIGVSFHVGSGCFDPSAFRAAIQDASCVFKIGKAVGCTMTVLDIGGGFPGQEEDFKFEQFSSVINPALDQLFPVDSGVQVIAEPGTYFAQEAFTLAVNVIAVKAVTEELSQGTRKEEGTLNGSQGDQERTIVKSMMYYINDGVYGSFRYSASKETLKIYPHRLPLPDEPTYPSIIWGPTCDVLDIVLRCVMPKLQLSDWLLVDNFGSYTISMSSNFNGFGKAHIYFVMSPESWCILQHGLTTSQ